MRGHSLDKEGGKYKNEWRHSLMQLNITEQSRYILERKYKQVGESDEEFINRIVNSITEVEVGSKRVEWGRMFYQVLANLEFIPGGSIMANAGIPVNVEIEQDGVIKKVSHPNGGLNNCSAIEVDDNIESIANVTKEYIIMSKHRMGIGLDMSPISYRGRPLRRLYGKEVASGVVSMMKLITESSSEMSIGGSRRSAGLIALRWDHRDILHFINCKRGSILKTIYNPKTGQLEDSVERPFQNVNLSVLLDTEFWECLDNNDSHATTVWDALTQSAWETGDPGVIFLDNVNRNNPLRDLWGDITIANACSEIPMYPYEVCCLGHINLIQHLKEVDGVYFIDWDKLENTVRVGIRFLDNVIDASYYPFPKIRSKVQQLRRIGLGVIGLADMLLKMRVPYCSERCIEIVDSLFRYIRSIADVATEDLGKEKGSFLMLRELVRKGIMPDTPRRNIATMAAAPSGSTTMIAGCEGYSLQPIFAHSYIKHLPNINDSINGNSGEYRWINPELPPLSYEDERLLIETGSVKDTSLSDSEKALYATAMDISPEKVLRVYATAQKWIDNSISYTINLRNEATVEDVKRIFRTSHSMGLKSGTVYRDGSLENQIISFGIEQDKTKYCRLDGSCNG